MRSVRSLGRPRSAISIAPGAVSNEGQLAGCIWRNTASVGESTLGWARLQDVLVVDRYPLSGPHLPGCVRGKLPGRSQPSESTNVFGAYAGLTLV